MLYYIDKLVLPYAPRLIVYYCGSNDINVNAQAEHIATRFKQFAERVHAKLPRTQIFFVSINRAPQKMDKWQVVDDTNALIKSYCLAAKNLGYIDVNRALFDKRKQPRYELYLPDKLHFVDKAYELFTPIIKPVIARAWRQVKDTPVVKAVVATDVPPLLNWNQAQRQKPEWYASSEAQRIADHLLLYQRATGGWPKNTNMAVVLNEPAKAELAKLKAETDSTIDNGSTYTQMAFLARVFTATKTTRYQVSFNQAFDYLLKAQYDNGGWPQFYPDLSGYYQHITYNDNAMVGVLNVLRDIARQQPNYLFVNAAHRAQAERAVTRGTECILKTQIIVADKKTAWCAQHDEVTLAPAKARAYEHPSLSGSESVGIVRFLMGIERPDARVTEAIESAVAWFKAVQINGFKYYDKRDAALEQGHDRILEAAANAGPLWARFYEIGTNRPIFSGRDSVIKYSVAEIEHERRTGYGWYSEAARDLLAQDYPRWQQRTRR